jgi:predicted  nucleic acid-binding Zn-ribbon protein
MNTCATIYKMAFPYQVLDENGVTAIQEGVMQALSTSKTMAESIEGKVKDLDKEIKKLGGQMRRKKRKMRTNLSTSVMLLER